MILRPPRSTRTDTLFPYTTLFRSIRILPVDAQTRAGNIGHDRNPVGGGRVRKRDIENRWIGLQHPAAAELGAIAVIGQRAGALARWIGLRAGRRSEEHTSELQSLMRTSYAVFCLKKKIKKMQT